MKLDASLDTLIFRYLQMGVLEPFGRGSEQGVGGGRVLEISRTIPTRCAGILYICEDTEIAIPLYANMNMETYQPTPADLAQIERKGISRTQLERQLSAFEEGFPYLSIVRAADAKSGITVLNEKQSASALETWADVLRDPSVKVLKFVPASGAASRMFRDLHRFLNGDEPSPAVREVLDHIQSFAFYDALNRACMLGEGGKTVPKLFERGEERVVIKYLLTEVGLNYANLPKALVLFHKYPQTPRTAMEEHLAEGALYTRNSSGVTHLHFTLSPEHIKPFEALLQRRKEALEETYGTVFSVTHSIQKPSTDTVAVDLDNHPIRDEKGALVFRPGGHGALIENLNDVDADIIFIKNIDNVVPDFQKSSTIIHQKILGGYLVSLRDKVYRYAGLLASNPHPGATLLSEIQAFMRDAFCIETGELSGVDGDDALAEIRQEENSEAIARLLRLLLNRPIRVCGMVRNEGEPGGGPYIIRDKDGRTGLQILEASQINKEDLHAESEFRNSRYFNPVDIVCCTKDYRGNKYDLRLFVDPDTGFISNKSKNGQELKALELPGLWNGAMSKWNTAFVEVPADTFNPVKTVNDLLRPAHSAQ